MTKIFNNKVILLTGGTGSIGVFIVEYLSQFKFKKLIIFSRDEFKQYEMQKKYFDKRIHYIIGDIRDREHLVSSSKNTDFIIHAAALKHVSMCENNPFETIKTNIIGSQNIVFAAQINNVSKVVSISTDKASMPINLYGASKLASDKLFIAANNSHDYVTKFSIVRYGNVFSSRGSVYPLYKDLIRSQTNCSLPLTDIRMTRFWITSIEAVKSITKSFELMQGGEIFIPKVRSFKIIDLIKTLNKKYHIVGIRSGEKIHETLICKDDNPFTLELKESYIIHPPFMTSSVYVKKLNCNCKKVKSAFEYVSNIKSNFIPLKKIKEFIKDEDRSY